MGKPCARACVGHERGSESTGRRPLAEAHRLNQWIFSWLPELPDDAYDIVAPMKAAGYTHHIAIPVVLPNGMRNGFTFATRAPSGFSDEDVAVLRTIMPTLAALQEILALHRVMREVMRMYVGDEPHRRILSGDVRRGEVLRIRAAMLFADMRNFTGITGAMSEEAATELGEPIRRLHRAADRRARRRGAEIHRRRHSGDFSRRREQRGRSLLARLAAARAGLEGRPSNAATMAASTSASRCISAMRPSAMSDRGARLDYTVIGRDVNLASRFGRSVRRTGRGAVAVRCVSKPAVGAGAPRSGVVLVKGVDEAQTVFAPVGP